MSMSPEEVLITQEPRPSSAGNRRAWDRPAHLVHFYEDDEALTAAVGKFVSGGLLAAELVTIIATREHLEAVGRHVRARGVDLDAVRTSGRLLFLDAHETLAAIMRDGAPDRGLFESVIGDVMSRRSAAANGIGQRAYGEMVDILWKRGEKRAALHLEELWNGLQGRQPFTLLCAYAMGQFYKEPATIHGVCAPHTQIVGLRRDGEQPKTAVRAASVTPDPTEVAAREILHREEMELALRESLRELRAKEEELHRSEEQLRDFFENGTVALHRVDADGRILWANRAELDLLGYRADEYIGRPISDFHADQVLIADILTRLVRGEALHDVEAQLRAKDGTTKHVLISSSGYFRDGEFVHSRCFTRDITERRNAEQAVRDSEQQLQLITDALPSCISYIDRDIRYRFVNATYEQWFGRSKEGMVGRRVEEVIGARAYERVGPCIARALSGETASYTGEVTFSDGQTRFVEATYMPQLDRARQIAGVVALISDVSERRAFERFRASAAARAERLLKVTAALADAVATSEVFEAVVDLVAAAAGALNAALWLVDDEARTLVLVRSIGFDQATARRFGAIPLDATPSIPVLDAIRRGEPLWISSPETMSRDYPQLKDAMDFPRAYRVACLPLGSQSGSVGVLAITSEESGEPSDDERSFLLLVARYAGQAIQRLRLLECERRSRTEADAAAGRLVLLNQASRAFGDADLDLDARLRSVAAGLATALDSSINLALIGPDGRLHLTALHHPIPEAHEELLKLSRDSSLRLGEGATGSMAATGKTILIPKIDPQVVAREAALDYRAFLARYPVHALMGVPLRARGQIIGTVTAARCRPDQGFTTEDLKLLEELGERAAATIENARLHTEAVNARARAEQLYRFAQAVVAADRLEVVLEAALDALETAVGAKRAAILISDADGVMRFRAWRRLSEKYRHAVEGHSPWPRDAVAPQPVLVGDVEADPSMKSFLTLFHDEGIGSLAFIPLVTRGHLIGKFMLYFREAHVYSEQEIELSSAIAHHLASVTARFEAFSKLEETIRYNDLFAGVLAHDLRNPLGAMMTAGQILLMRNEGAADLNAKPVSRILSSGQRMMTMIDQLLDVTRARAGGGIEVRPRNTDLGDLCSQAIDELELAFPRWTIQRKSTGALRGEWDPDRLLQVISNLVSNAGQHGRPQGVVAVNLDGREPDTVILRIQNGGAIPASVLPSLFDPFRGSRQPPDASRGLGLGLFIVKEIARAHGGSVDVSSSDPEGTTFTLRLPRRATRSLVFDSPSSRGR